MCSLRQSVGAHCRASGEEVGVGYDLTGMESKSI